MTTGAFHCKPRLRLGNMRPSFRKVHFLRSSRGDTSVLLVFLILTALLLGATALVVLSIGNLRGAGNIAASSQALYNADSAIERGLSAYRWSNPNSPTCLNEENTFDRLRVHSDLNRTDCPLPSQLGDPPGGRALCVEAIGKARGGLVRRRVTNDSDSTRCDPLR